MTVRTTYASGEPCWADLQTPDVDAAKDFYGRLFGWTYQDFPTPDGRSYAVAVMIKLTSVPLPVRMELMNNVVRAVIAQHDMQYAPAAQPI